MRNGDGECEASRGGGVEERGEIIAFVERRDGGEDEGFLRDDRASGIGIRDEERGGEFVVHASPRDLVGSESGGVDVVERPEGG